LLRIFSSFIGTYCLKAYGLLGCDIIMIFSSARLYVKMCWCKHSVLQLIFNFLPPPVSSFILQIPRMMNQRKRLTPPSFLWQFWAKLLALLVSVTKFIAHARPGIYTVSRNSTLSWLGGTSWSKFVSNGRETSTLRDVFYVHESLHRESVSIIVQQDATIYSLLYFCKLLAPHVSGGNSTHHQEHI
jgi:hypothetical protein